MCALRIAQMPLREVKAADLATYLAELRGDGYILVALEQRRGAVPLAEYRRVAIAMYMAL